MPSRQEVISFNRISKTFERKIALSSLSFRIRKGEHIALIGPSGAGKTTLLNLMASIISPDEGAILLDGEPLSSLSNQKKRAKKIGIIRQQFDLVGQLPVIHNVLVGKLADWGLLKSLLSLAIPQDRQTAIEALERVGLSEKLYDHTSTLSGGEQQRVALARLLVQNPEIILADEPVASLDPARAEDVLDLLTKIANEEKQTLIASLHSVEYARKYFTRLIALKDGGLFFDVPSDRLTDSQITALYQLKEQG
ncbi:phosphonate ABC transporter ATP-binding protein [Bacillus sp. REN3]|uniref:phosphonate ABC transporter ATP-binding protein n=1 Tax=Bacillus sp. REN3 TaxID=2802440 RepID=UPI001AEF1C97|nr:phosphonate ABC transporter ATP-binding protein [Bacillus sp. REN3]